MIAWWLVAGAVVGAASGAWYDTFTGNRVTDERVEALRANGLIPWCAMEIKDCSPHEPRRLDYTCNNLRYPQRGATLTPYHRMLRPNYAADGGLRPAKSGRALPNARALRVSLISDGRVSSHEFTHMLTNMNVFIIGDVTSVHDTVNYVVLTTTCCSPTGSANPRCIPIPVADNDLHLRNSDVRCLNLTRSITYQSLGCVPSTLPGERINTAPPMLELSNVYGTEEDHARRFRSGKGGRLDSEMIRGKEWPTNGSAVCINNRPPENRCHSTEAGANSLLGINLIYIWFFRNHNFLADALHKLNPCWDDHKLYTVAKDINIALYQHIVYYELMPTAIGEKYLEKMKVIFPGHLHVDDYDEEMEPRLALEYVLATRWFHVMQEGRINLYDKYGNMFNQLSVVDMTLRTGILVRNDTIEGATQGAFRQPCADHRAPVIDPEMGERSLGRLQRVSDVLSADIMKNRDVGLPPYGRYRALCKLPVPKSFDDLYQWMSVEHVEALAAAYEDVDDIDLMAGMLGEEAMPGAVMGPTLACIMTEQLLRWRRADRFWYENTVHPGAFTKDQLREIKRITMSKIMCDHADTVEAIQPNVFYLPGHGNEFTPCSRYPSLNMKVWKDHKCDAKNQPPLETPLAPKPQPPLEEEVFVKKDNWWSFF